MEHNRKHSTDEPVFAVTAVLAGPDVETEKMFVLTELERVDKLIKDYRRQGLWKKLAGRAMGPSPEDYRRYRHDLLLYRQRLERFAQEMQEGSIPFRVIVTNLGGALERRIHTTVRVKDGRIALTKVAPERPERIDSEVQHVTEAPSYNLAKSFTGGFVRSGVRMGPAILTADFSNLGGGEEAALVNQTLFLEMTPETTMWFELSSEHHPAVTGEVYL